MRRPNRGVLDDPNHWHGRADAARLVAEQYSDPVARDMMLQIARLAEHARQRAKTGERKTTDPRCR
jgi:hypothetical protein